MNPLERRYRRVLRLLPAGYRRAWEEDMVSAFLQSADGASRPSFGERLSVAALAVRLRFTGSHASPRSLVWYRTVGIVALLALLFQALGATARLARAGTGLALLPDEYPQGILGLLLVWVPLADGLIWIAAFLCLALGRPAEARPLTLLAASVAVGIATAIVTFWPGYLDMAGVPAVAHVAVWGWLALTVVAVVAVPRVAVGQRQAAWSIGYLASALAVVALTVLTMLGHLAALGGVFLIYTLAAHGGLLVGMVALLLGAAIGRPNPAGLLALSLFGSFDVLAHLLDPLDSGGAAIAAFHVPLPAGRVEVEALLGALALVCAVVGLLALRRLPRTVPGPA